MVFHKQSNKSVLLCESTEGDNITVGGTMYESKLENATESITGDLAYSRCIRAWILWIVDKKTLSSG